MQKKEPTYIYGTHALNEAFARAPHALRHVYLVGARTGQRFFTKAQQLGVPVDRCDENHLPRGVDKNANHQGVLALIAPNKILVPYKKFIQSHEAGPHTAFVLLDELTDPHNVGAVIRNAAAFGVSAVLIPERRQAQVTGTVVKVSAGMAFALPLVSVVNVNTVLRDLKERGFWVYGLSSTGRTPLHQERFTRPSVFVLGNEGKGLREKTEELCDFTIRIPIEKKCESLNAATSAGVVFYAWKNSVSSLKG